MTIDRVIEKLRGVRQSGNGFMALCPTHDDKDNSLSITEAEDGKVLLHCFAGCKTEDIVKVAGLTMRDLGPDRNQSLSARPPRRKSPLVDFTEQWGEIVREYTNPDPVNRYLCEERKLAQGTVDTVQGSEVSFYRYYGKEVIACAYKTLDGAKVAATQMISATGRPLNETGAKKIFLKGSKPSVDGFFQCGKPIAQAGKVFIVEGAINALSGAECVPEACWLAIGGSEFTKKLKLLRPYRDAGKEVILFLDNDPAGGKARNQAARILGKKALSIVWPDDIPWGHDVNDLLKGGKHNTIVAMAKHAEPVKVEKPEKASKGDNGGPTQTEILLAIAKEAELFHGPDGQTCYASIPVAEHREIHEINSSGFKRWLRKRFFELSGGSAPGGEAVNTALRTIEGLAQFDGPAREVYIRVAESGGNIYIDLCDDQWRVIEIMPAGWRLLEKSPVPFRRAKGMLPLCIPKANGKIDRLRQFLNLRKHDESWRLIVAWLVQALRPFGPYPAIAFSGEQGAAKSTASRILRNIVDPSSVPLRTSPRSERDLAISGGNGWVIALDNLSNVQPWLSDALCRISTGGGFTTRSLYTNNEESLFCATRPIVLNGISDIVNRHDLADRCLFIILPPIPDEKRIPESQLNRQFERVLPDILGGLCDILCVALRNIETVKLDRLPRMADFAMWIQAAEPALPWEAGGFMAIYDKNRAQLVEKSIEADIVGAAILGWLGDKAAWKGTATELLRDLESVVDEKTTRQKGWPKDGTRMSKKLRRISSFLRRVGVDIEFPDNSTRGRREISISMQNSVVSVASVVSEENQHLVSNAKSNANNATTFSVADSVAQKNKEYQADNANNANNAKKHTNQIWKGSDEVTI